MYCPYLPKERPGLPKVTVPPFEILYESLREKCVYEELAKEKNTNGNFTRFFNYALNFIDECINNN
jgi:hypothetical protein